MSGLHFEPLHRDFGARVTGVALTGKLSEPEVEAVREAIDTWSLLCFPGQSMSDEAHLDFTRRLGEPEAEHVTLGKTGKVVYLGTVGNVSEDGSRHGNEHPRTRYQTGNEMWHSDSSFRLVPFFVSVHSPIAERTELHTHEMEDGVMKMRRIPSAVVPAGGELAFEPGEIRDALQSPPCCPRQTHRCTLRSAERSPACRMSLSLSSSARSRAATPTPEAMWT